MTAKDCRPKVVMFLKKTNKPEYKEKVLCNSSGKECMILEILTFCLFDFGFWFYWAQLHKDGLKDE